MEYWQIASGSLGRYYAKDFIRFGMAFVGGAEQASRMAEVKVGDRILLKRGTTKVVAAGEVVERDGKHRGNNDKGWLRDFDGWDLRAYCFVNWHKPDKPRGTTGLTRYTIQNVAKRHLKDLAEEIISSVLVEQNLDLEPRDTRSVPDTEIIGYLINQGLRPRAAEDLTATFNRIRLLARYYYRHRWEVRLILLIGPLRWAGMAHLHRAKPTLPGRDKLVGRRRAKEESHRGTIRSDTTRVRVWGWDDPRRRAQVRSASTAGAGGAEERGPRVEAGAKPGTATHGAGGRLR